MKTCDASCQRQLREVVERTSSTPIRFIRRLKQRFIKSTHCSVRYDSSIGKWAVVDSQFAPIRHITTGLLSKVSFSVRELSTRSGCGSSPTSIGLATGDLIEEFLGVDHFGFKNLSFNGEAFLDERGNPISSAQTLRLLPNRKALYK